MSDWSERRTALAIGHAYRVLRTARSFPSGSDFEVGEVVTLDRVDYSRYDSSYFYAFMTASGVSKSFLLHDDEPLTTLTSTFA